MSYGKFLFLILVHACFCTIWAQKSPKLLPRLRLSASNLHLLETSEGKPVFLNNFTLWKLIEHGKREDADELLTLCQKNKYNMVSSMVLGFTNWENEPHASGVTPYGAQAFARTSKGFPDPAKPITTPGNDPKDSTQYDFWDHVDYLIDLAAQKGMYIGLHPAWGNWFSGFVHGQKPEDALIFNEFNAYVYGQWLGQRFKTKTNIIWMLGGDRSAIYDKQTKWYGDSLVRDYRPLYRAMAEGLADGTNGVNKQDGQADYTTSVISYHPRKWAPNSADWFHQDNWLTFNSIQDTPIDQMKYLPRDYNLMPTKPTWLYEPIYEGAIHAWGVRYQAYQTALMGGFGHTYGSDIWAFRANWRTLAALPANGQMAHLYKVVREIWTDEQYINRMPDQSLIIGDQGKVKGRGITAVKDFETKQNQNDESSDRITAMRGKDGSWAMVYTANGRPITLDLSRITKGKRAAYWFNPRNGTWGGDKQEHESMTPFLKKLKTGVRSQVFTPPSEVGADNDWVLVIK